MSKPSREDLARTVQEMKRYGKNGPNRGVPPESMDIWADMVAAILATPDQPEPASGTVVAEMRRFAAFREGNSYLNRFADALEAAETGRHAVTLANLALRKQVEAGQAELAESRDASSYNLECYQDRVKSLEAKLEAAEQRCEEAQRQRDIWGEQFADIAKRWSEFEDEHKAAERRCEELAQSLVECEGPTAFGQKCYQDRCENAYVEASVVKMLEEEIAGLKFQLTQQPPQGAAVDWDAMAKTAYEIMNEPYEDRISWNSLQDWPEEVAVCRRAVQAVIAAYEASRPREKIESIVQCDNHEIHAFESEKDASEFLRASNTAHSRFRVSEWHYHPASSEGQSDGE